MSGLSKLGVEVYKTSCVNSLTREPYDLIIVRLDFSGWDLQLLECLLVQNVDQASLFNKSLHHYVIMDGYDYNHWIVLLRVNGLKIAVCEGNGWHLPGSDRVGMMHCLHAP